MNSRGERIFSPEWLVVVVICDPASDQSQDGLSVGRWRHLDVVALERLHECLRDASKFIFRARGWVRHFFEASQAQKEYVVVVTETAPYHINVSIEHVG